MEEHIDLRVSDLLETLKDGVPHVDLLSLDSKLSFAVLVKLLMMHCSLAGTRTSYSEDSPTEVETWRCSY